MPVLSLERVGRSNRVGPYEKRTLVDVSLSLAAGDFVGVWGGRRCGKTTLIRIAAGLERADTGAAYFEGRDLSTLSRADRADLRRTSIGVVTGAGPQSREFTVTDFVALPLHSQLSRRQARERALAILRTTNMIECRDARWHEISDSEKALVSLANGLVRQPRLLLVDDPTSGLIDTLQLREIITILRTAATTTATAVLMTASTATALAGTHDAYHLTDGTLHHINHPTNPTTILTFPNRSA